jgi:hypothetical protein
MIDINHYFIRCWGCGSLHDPMGDERYCLLCKRYGEGRAKGWRGDVK